MIKDLTNYLLVCGLITSGRKIELVARACLILNQYPSVLLKKIPIQVQ